MLISEHPKMVDRWARRYISLYRSGGRDAAIAWATKLLPPSPRNKMAERVQEILNAETKRPRT